MAYTISTETCIACGTCQDECPSEAIKEGDEYSIDPNICVDCGICADACPVGAISHVGSLTNFGSVSDSFQPNNQIKKLF